MFYLDITRTFNRAISRSPTGIDRVEIEYAKSMLRSDQRFVVQSGDCLVEAPTWLVEDVLRQLDERWGNGGDPDARVMDQIDRWRKGIKLKKTMNNIEKFFLSLEGKSYRQRLKRLMDERQYIAGKVPYIPVALSARFVALFHRKFRKFVTPKEKASEPGFLVRPLFKEAVYVNVGHTGLEKTRLFDSLHKIKGLRIFIYVHDVLPISHPHLFKDGQDKVHAARIKNVIKFADVVCANSTFTAAEIEKFAGRKVVKQVLEIGTPPQSEGVRIPVSQRHGFVSIGTVEPRKNYLWLVDQWISFCSENSRIVKDEKLRIFGAIGWLQGEDLSRLLGKIEGSSSVELISGASDSTINLHLSRARAYVSAAEVEGWGMPLAESLALGTPVIASDVPAHREVTQGIASFFPYNDGATLQSEFLQHFDDGVLNNRISDVDRFKPWTWDVHLDRFSRAVFE